MTHNLLCFSPVNVICEMYKFYYDRYYIHKKIMAVQNKKCHFASEQQLISSIKINQINKK